MMRTTARRLTGAAAGIALAMLAMSDPALAIVGGHEDPALGRHAVMVLNARGGFCSAVVIGPQVLLTAGHCVTGNTGHVVHWRAADGTPVMVEPAAIAVHPGYVADAPKRRARSIDLALVRLREPLPEPFAPARLAREEPPRPGASATVAGYGLSAEGAPTTGGRFRSAPVGVVEPYGPSKVLLWLSDGPRTLAGACAGDSGGPVFAAGGDVVAVTAFAVGERDKSCGAMTQAVLVAPQRAWIEATLAGWGLRPE